MADKWYEFNPQSNITAYELAQILKVLMMIKINEELKAELPKYADRHFQEARDDENIHS
jgi:hypothetical protein